MGLQYSVTGATVGREKLAHRHLGTEASSGTGWSDVPKSNLYRRHEEARENPPLQPPE